jgi:hypothetical protein
MVDLLCGITGIVLGAGSLSVDTSQTIFRSLRSSICAGL